MRQTSDMSSTDYEILIQNIHKAIMNSQGISNIEVEHNKKIEGASGQKHQIDVYWKFRIGNLEYQTAIECRRYTKPITIDKIAAFNTVLEDIGNINGIMITTSGFQKGAKTLALHRRIGLAVLRTVNDSDLEGIISVIRAEIRCIMKHVISWNVNTSEKWADENFIPHEERPLSFSGMNNEIGLCNKDGVLLKTFRQIQNDLKDKDGSKDGPEFNEIATQTIDVEGMYLNHKKYGLIPLVGFSVTYVTRLITSTIESRDPLPAHYIFEDIVNKDNTIHIHEGELGIVLKKE